MKKRLLMMLSILLLSTFVFSEIPDQAQYQGQDEYQAQYYDNAKVLRVKYAQGETYVQRSYEDGFEEATANLSIFEKDKVGTTDGNIEIYLGRLNYLRLDDDTEVEFDRVPELRKTDLTLRVNKGGIYLDIENLDNERDIEVQTPDCGVFLLNKGVYRINVNERGHTEVLVYEGLAEVSGEDYSRNVRESQKIIMANGRVIENPFYFYASNSDEFDRWNQERKSSVGYARYGTSRYLSHGYEDYEYELSHNGRWVYYNDYREYIWIPYHIGSSWSPYCNGRWIWNPFYGYVWTSYDDWGYFTHHYGRWHWDNHYGWYWYPGYHWSPAWVYWFWDNDYYGWCPLSRWNRPIIIINNQWMKNHDHHRNGIPIHSKGTVIIKKNQLSSSHIERVAINKTTLKNINIAAKGFSPKERPSRETVKIVNARGKTVAYKKSGFQETKKYEILKPSISTNTAKAPKEVEYKYRESGNKTIEQKAFKYSKRSKSEAPASTKTNGRETNRETNGRETNKKEIKIEKKNAVIPSSKSYPEKSSKSNNSDTPEKKYKEKSTARSNSPQKNQPTEPSKTRYKPSESKKTKESGSSGAKSKSAASSSSSKSSSSSSSHSSSSSSTGSQKVKVKVKEKEKHSPGFSSSKQSYPSRTSRTSDSSSTSYRSTNSTRYKSQYNSSSETYIPSYRSQYPSMSGNYQDVDNSSSQKRKTYSSSSSSHSSYSGSSSHSSSYSSPSSSHSSHSSYSGSSSHSSSYSSPSSSHSSHSSHSSYSGSSSGSHHSSTAVKKRN